MSRFMDKTHWLLALILLVGVVARMGWGMSRPVTRESMEGLPDQLEYLSLGENLWKSGELSMVDARYDQRVYAYRTPGYPIFVALCQGLPRLIYIVQALLDSSVVLAIFLMARRWLREREALFASALVALNPWLIFYTGTLLSETLYIAMLSWGLCLLCRQGRDALGKSFFGGLALLAMGAMVRPSGLGLVPLAGAMGVLACAGRVPGAHAGDPGIRLWKLRVRAMVMAVVAGLILLLAIFLPWSVRNYVQPGIGRWVWTTTNAGVTAYDGFGPGADGASDQSGFLAQMPELKGMGEVQRSDYLAGKASSAIRSDPGRAIRLGWQKITRTWSLVPHAEQARQGRYQWASGIYGSVLFGLAFIGLLRKSLPKSVKVLLLAPAVYFTVVVAMSVGSIRYRTPAEVPLAILAGAAVVRKKPSRLEHDDRQTT